MTTKVFDGAGGYYYWRHSGGEIGGPYATVYGAEVGAGLVSISRRDARRAPPVASAQRCAELLAAERVAWEAIEERAKLGAS